jgi:hypothetical protein
MIYLLIKNSCKLLIFSFLFLVSCTRSYYIRNDFQFPDPVDTKNREIEFQEKKVYEIDGLKVDNSYEGARLNGFQKISDSIFEATIKAENYPINESPWYSFRILTSESKSIFLKLKYINANHRYIPKISFDRNIWNAIDSSLVKIDKEDHSATFRLELNNPETYISAQEIISSTDIEFWNNSLKSYELVSDLQSIGTTPLGKNLNFFRIGKGVNKGKKVIVLTTRMHPPEVSGFKAFQAFVETILTDTLYSEDFFKKHELWVFPCMNPDGVDLGNWRHNSNGVDLNRDWAYYRQPEINIITKYIVERAKKHKNKIVLSLDFHSTSQDIYYVFDDKFRTKLKDFTKKWTEEIDKTVFPFKTIFSPEPLGKPFSKTWFYKQFKAESITYEVGDETDRNIIKRKAEAAALYMMKLLKR